jgi:outer membrane lipopolysaccharide assembly protein LptE/RlpB
LPRDLQDRISHGGTEFTENAIGTMLRNHILKSRKDNRKFLLLRLCVTVAILLTSCGYHVGGTASRLPPGLKVIDVSAFVNRTNQYRIEQRMTQAVVREFLERTRYRVVSTEESADAVLHGEITTMESSPVVFDTTPTQNPPTSSTSTTTIARATTMLVSVHMKVTLEERETKKILYKNDNYLFREIYEISTDPTKFFDEQSPALERMAKDFAARLVSDVVENF